MPLQGKVCNRGVWDESVPEIKFDEDGVSNYAHLHDALCKAYPRGEIGANKWLNIVDKIKQAGEGKQYDCIIGVSGGTDSCYLLHMAKELGLRVLAVNLDNGWSSEIAVANIKKITSALSIDLETYVIDYEEIKDLLRSYMLAGLPWIDIPTDLAIKAILYKIASRENIKYILRGNDFRSEGSQPTEWTYGDGKQLKAIHKMYGKVKLKTFPNYTIESLIYYGFIKKIKSIYPFYYIEYKKNKAQEFLKAQYDWQYYGGHHFENIFTKFAISYWLYEKFGIDKRKITLSAQILSGEMDRVSALDIINSEPYSLADKDVMIDFMLKKLEIESEHFENILKDKNKTYKDYPSYYYLFKKLNKSFQFIIKLVFIHKPQSLYKTEIIGV